MRFWLLLLLGDSRAVSSLDSEKPAAVSLTLTCRGQRVFMVSPCTSFFRAAFLSAPCMIKNRNHEPQRDLEVGPLGA